MAEESNKTVPNVFFTDSESADVGLPSIFGGVKCFIGVRVLKKVGKPPTYLILMSA